MPFIGFDDLGRQFDLNGNLEEWWDPETKLKFLNRTNCIIEQYGNFTEPKLKMNVGPNNLKLCTRFNEVLFRRLMVKRAKAKILLTTVE